MTQQEIFGIAAFSSRRQVMLLDSALRRAGLHSDIISTPRDVSLGCGLSVRFELGEADRVIGVARQNPTANLIGFYRVTRAPGRKAQVTPL